MQITKQWLEDKNACESGLLWFTNQTETDGLKIVKKLIKENKIDDANWLIVRMMKYKQYVAYGIFAAEQVVYIWKQKYPKDTRPQEAIAAAKICLKNLTKKNKKIATAAADAAYATAAYDAYAAASAADATAGSAASAAAYDAYSASAAASAAYDAREKMELEILNYGIELLEEGKCK